MINSTQKSVTTNITLLVVTGFILASCMGSQKAKVNTIKKIIVTRNMPFLVDSSNLVNLKDSFCIVYFQNYILYQFPYTKTMENDTAVLSVKTLFRYFVFNKDSVNGFWYDPMRENFVTKKNNVDSTLVKYFFASSKPYSKTNDSLYGSIKHEQNKRYRLFFL